MRLRTCTIYSSRLPGTRLGRTVAAAIIHAGASLWLVFFTNQFASQKHLLSAVEAGLAMIVLDRIRNASAQTYRFLQNIYYIRLRRR